MSGDRELLELAAEFEKQLSESARPIIDHVEEEFLSNGSAAFRVHSDGSIKRVDSSLFWPELASRSTGS